MGIMFGLFYKESNKTKCNEIHKLLHELYLSNGYLFLILIVSFFGNLYYKEIAIFSGILLCTVYNVKTA